jgi:hypothetical protein
VAEDFSQRLDVRSRRMMIFGCATAMTVFGATTAMALRAGAYPDALAGACLLAAIATVSAAAWGAPAARPRRSGRS